MNFGPNADICWILYAEGLVVGRMRANSTESVVDVGAVAPLAGPTASELGFITSLSGSYEIQVEHIIVAADSPEDKTEWLDAFAERAAISLGTSRHEAIRGTVWSLVVTDDLNGLDKCLTSIESPEELKILVDAPDNQGRTALHYAAESKTGAPYVSALLRSGAATDPLDDALSTPLLVACLSGNVQCVDALIRGGADKEAKNLSHQTPFLALVAHVVDRIDVEPDYDLDDHRGCLERLADIDDESQDAKISMGCNVNARDLSGKTALHLMVLSKKEASFHGMTLLMTPPCKCDPRLLHGNEKRSALHDVALDPDDQESNLCVRKAGLLLEYGCRPNQGDVYGDTPLMYCLRGAQTVPVETDGGLVAPPQQQQQQRSYPILTSARVEMAKTLVQFGARLDVLNLQGKSPLEAAKAQRVDFQDSVAKWTARREPPQTTVLANNPSTLSYLPAVFETTVSSSPKSPLTIGGPPESCLGCRKTFTTLNRKTICKRCGFGFCSTCAVKSFTMAKGRSYVKDKACDACFNAMCTSVERSSDAIHRLEQDRRVRQDKETEREDEKRAILFANVVERVEARTEPTQLEAAESATSAVHQTRDALERRGEKLDSLNRRAAQMKDSAESFASNAAKLAEQQKKSWF